LIYLPTGILTNELIFKYSISSQLWAAQELTLEEERFSQTLERGQKQLDDLLAAAKASNKVI
jgi:alanyl-tRNA synthetase